MGNIFESNAIVAFAIIIAVVFYFKYNDRVNLTGGPTTDFDITNPEGDTINQEEPSQPENPTTAIDYDEDAIMDIVTKVREDCYNCSNNSCHPKCKKIEGVCKNLMGHGYYPNIQCPTDGVQEGIPVPFNLYSSDGDTPPETVYQEDLPVRKMHPREHDSNKIIADNQQIPE